MEKPIGMTYIDDYEDNILADKVRSVLKKIRRTFFKILMIYIAYRLVNLAIVNVIYEIRKDQINDVPFPNSGICLYFESPAPMINDVVDYDNLALCHKLIVSRKEYEKNSNYNFQIIKTNLSFLLLPWTMRFNPFNSDNSDAMHQFGSYNGILYDVDVWFDYNVFTLAPEEMVLFTDDFIFWLFIILILAAFITVPLTVWETIINK